MDDIFAKEPDTTTRYYSWEDEPCRIYRDPDGDLSADVYRAGKGLVEIDATDLYHGSFPISKAYYKTMVMKIVTDNKQAGQEQ